MGVQNNIDPFKVTQFGLGFDSFIDKVQTGFFSGDTFHGNYPPYNIIKNDDLTYGITLAVAGFSEKDLEIEYTDNTLIVRTKDTKEEKDKQEVIHQGIALRSFTRQWSLADDVIVTGATLVNGLLTISMEKVVPEDKKKRLIKIN